MTIIAPGAVLPAAGPDLFARRPGAGATGFTIPVIHREAAGSAGGAAPVTDASAMLALQEDIGRDADRSGGAPDREARRHGQDILEALAALQKDLLAGDPAQGLSRLAALAERMPTARDPALAQVLSSIRLRARLEILRLAPRSPGADPSASVTEP